MGNFAHNSALDSFVEQFINVPIIFYVFQESNPIHVPFVTKAFIRKLILMLTSRKLIKVSLIPAQNSRLYIKAGY